MSESETKANDCVELGYLLLEQTPIRVEGNSFCRRPHTWYQVPWGCGKDASLFNCAHDSICHKCELILCWDETTQTFCLPQTVDDETINPLVSANATCTCPTKSDGAIMLQVLRTIQSDICIKECRVLFLEDENAAMYFTLGFPRLGINHKNGKKSLLGTRTAKPLSNPWQLVLSLLRSDWEELDNFVESMQDPTVRRRTSRIEKSSLFPPKLSMEELYRRIQGSPLDEENRQRTLDRQLAYQSAPLARLPHEILEKRLAHFLAAKDLDNLRCTCWYFHGLFEGVVPGLKLQLYRHQVLSLAWMRDREKHELWEADCLQDSGRRAIPDGDLHRAATGGHTVRLLARHDTEPSFRVDTFTGLEFDDDTIHSRNGGIPRRRVCRGGLLVDEPGLGKTITVLSLILQTAGLSTESCVQNVAEEDRGTDNKSLFDCYWRESVPSDFRRQDLLKLLGTIAKKAPRGIFPLLELKRNIDADAYNGDFDRFVQDMERTIRVADGTEVQDSDENTSPLLQTSRVVFDEYRERMLASAKKSFSNPRAKPNSNLAARLEEAKRIRFIKSLVPSRGTLIVIPSVLMDHWESQIDLHINMKYLLTNKFPLVFTFGTGGISLESATQVIREGRFEPLVFLDRGGTKTLPPAEFLAKFLIVITTTSRFSLEWKNGSFQEEVEMGAMPERLYESTMDRSAAEVCPLLKIHWLRMIIDEGHSMGRGSLGSSIQFASWVSSERRWAITGTPTKDGPTALSQVRNLMSFLQHDFFTPRCNGDAIWSKYISRPWKDGKTSTKEQVAQDSSDQITRTTTFNKTTGAYASFFRLRALLKLLMKRHTKKDIVELAPPVYKEKFVSMSHVEVSTYNCIVTTVQSNLLLTSMREDARQDSLLHQSQARYARQALDNIRRVCVGFSRVIPTLTERFWLETLMLMDHHNLRPERQDRIKRFMHNAQIEELTACDCCGLELSTLLVLPCCGGLICTECMDVRETEEYENDGSEIWMRRPINEEAKKHRKNKKYFKMDCLLCEGPFDVDDFQRLQPGFILNWRDNLKDFKASFTSDGEVPKRTEDIQALERAGGAQGGQHANEGLGIIIRPPAGRKKTKKLGDGHECEYDRYAIDGTCIHCHEEHNACNLLGSTRCNVCYRAARECPDDETKSHYLVQKCLSLVQGRQPCRADTGRFGEASRPVKIIIFSQFRKALNLVGTRLLGRFGTACVSEYWGRYRTQELHKFTHDPECFCMLLGRDGSEGLDLSFVTHIFFLEEIWDRSLAEQTVARAWRMGACGAVKVETILAKDSVEETMKAYESGQLTDIEDVSKEASSAKEKDQHQRKAHVLLKSLKFITDYHSFRKNPQKRPPPTPETFSQPPTNKRPRVTFANHD